MKPYDGPLFLIGMPRSGTKLLRRLLKQHPRICIPVAETEFFPWLVVNIDSYGDLSIRDHFLRFYKAVVRFPYFTYAREEGTLVSPERWYAACRGFDAAGVFEALIREEQQVAVGSDIIWGDKSPSYMTAIPLLHEHFPNARFIHIIRDARDYCLSMRDAWGKHMKRAAQRWTDSVRRARDDGRRIPGQYLEIRYEDLLRDTETVLRTVSDFLGIDFRETMLTLQKAPENLGNASGQSIIIKDNFGKFMTHMDVRTRRQIESIAGTMLVECGYQLSLPPQAIRRMSKRELLAAQLQDGWNRLLFERKRRDFGRALSFVLRYFQITRGR